VNTGQAAQIGPEFLAAEGLRRRRLRLQHDIRHEVATILLLASIIEKAADAGPATSRRVLQLLDETRWLEQLLRCLDELPEQPLLPVPSRVRLDVMAGEVVLERAVSGGGAGRHMELSDTERLAHYLTPREREVLSHLVLGESAPALARTIGVSLTTARSYIQNVLTKLGVHSQPEAVTAVVRDGLVSVETGRWRTR
jgi:DNA-binding CsgD family transcriptional regulator